MAAGFKTATVAAASVPATQTNFPSYVDLSRLGITTLAEAQSVRVYADAAKTTEWAREIVSATEMWTKIPSLTSTTSIYVDWDGVRADYAVTDTYGRNAVWSGALATWHLGDLTDSTGNYALTNNSAVTFGSTNALIPNTSIYNKTNANYLYQSSAFGRSYNSAYTFSFWVYINDDPTVDYDIADILVTGNPGQRFRILYEYNGGTRRIRMYQNTTVGTTFFDITGNVGATQARYDITFSGSAISMYKNASAAFSNVSNNANAGNIADISRLSLGNTRPSGYTAPLSGKIDETRLWGSVLSANWITTEYNNQSAESTFWGTWSTVSSGANTTNFFALM